jgi:cyclophilin family peptidyl-prolyl cis-trans isomerase
VFGRVIHGYDIVDKIEQNETGASDRPLKPVEIVDCGELRGADKLTEQ